MSDDSATWVQPITTVPPDLFPESTSPAVLSQDNSPRDTTLAIVLAVVLPLISIIGVLIVIYITRRDRNKQKEGESETADTENQVGFNKFGRISRASSFSKSTADLTSSLPELHSNSIQRPPRALEKPSESVKTKPRGILKTAQKLNKPGDNYTVPAGFKWVSGLNPKFSYSKYLEAGMKEREREREEQRLKEEVEERAKHRQARRASFASQEVYPHERADAETSRAVRLTRSPQPQPRRESVHSIHPPPPRRGSTTYSTRSVQSTASSRYSTRSVHPSYARRESVPRMSRFQERFSTSSTSSTSSS